MQSTSCEIPGWRKHKREIKIARRNISNLRYAADTTLMAEIEELEPLDENEKKRVKKFG